MFVHRLTLLLAVFLLTVMMPAHASEREGVQLNAGLQLMHDSNLFRLSSSANTLAILGQSSAADDITIASAGIGFRKSYSLQRIDLSLDLANYRYQTFSNLNFNARSTRAAWFWSLTPRLHGELSNQHSETAGSFTDSSNFTRSNRRTNTNTLFNGEFELNSAWRALGGFTRTRRLNQQSLDASDDFAANGAELGMRYLSATGSSITYRFKSTHGDFLNRNLSSTNFLDDRYQQLDRGLQLHWQIDGKLSTDANLTLTSRTHPNFPQRDFNGLNTGISTNWLPTDKTGLTVGWAHQLDSFQTNTSNYREANRLTLSPMWQPSTKTLMRLRYELAKVDYLGAPTALLGPQRSDTTRDVSLSLDWQAANSLNINFALQNAQRNSNQPGLDYTSSSANLSAQYSY